MQAHHLETSRTARYFTLGSIGETTREVWFLFHGYAQTADDLLKHFAGLENEYRCFVAPEGLNHFYAKGFGGKPVATWMTSLDRENEIKDYLNYLENLAQQIIPVGYSGTVHALGFSQGVATATRWIHATNRKVNELILYAGEVAAELRSPVSPKLLQTKNTYVTGTKDSLIKPEHKLEVLELMHTLNARIVEFDGGHAVLPEVVRLLFGETN